MALLIYFLALLVGSAWAQDSLATTTDSMATPIVTVVENNPSIDSYTVDTTPMLPLDSFKVDTSVVQKIDSSAIDTSTVKMIDSSQIDTAIVDTISMALLKSSAAVDSILPLKEVMFVVLSPTQEPVPNFKVILNNQDTLSSDPDGFILWSHTQDSVVSLSPLDSSWEFQQGVFALDPNLEFSQLSIQLRSKIKTTKLDSADIVVIADREVIHDRKQVSQKKLYRKELQEVAATQGDPLQVVKSLPGVTSSSDLNVRPYVRGGDERETRIFWNNIPLIQPYHALSAYSIFNMEAIDQLEFYSGGFPVEGNGSLSGALFMTSRAAPLDTVQGMVSWSLLRGDAYVGVPVVKDRLGVYFSYQAFLYDWMIKRAVDALDIMGSIKDSEADNFKTNLDLPNFKDLEYGVNYKINESNSLEYTALNALDIFRVLNPSDPSQAGQAEDILSIPDTLALVDIPNWIHGLNLKTIINNRWTMQNTLAYQSQTWHVNFADNQLGNLFALNRTSINFRNHNLYQLNEQHLLTFGLGFDFKYQEYDVNVPKAVYEMIVRGNNDLFDAFGYFNSEGLVITKDGLFTSLSDYSEQLIMDYEGRREQYYTSAYFSDEFKLDKKQRFEFGARIEHESHSGDLFIAPRASWFKSLDPKTELTIASGLYSQNEFEFYYQHFNNQLVSEKAWHTNIEFSHDFTPHYTIEWSNYSKIYYDLAAPRLKETDQINTELFWSAMNIFAGISTQQERREFTETFGYSVNEFENEMEKNVEAALDFLPEKQASDIRNAINKKTLDFQSRGQGYALGSEISFKYDPTPDFRGWISAEYSVSERKDRANTNWYAFKEHRPWSIKWHNYFNMPNNYEFAIKASVTAGKAYTGYQTPKVDSDTVMVIEEKNNRRFSPYTRVDFRLSQQDTLFGYPFMSFFEVWNSFNEPNFILTDSETGEFKAVEFNFPIPIFFVGYELRF